MDIFVGSLSFKLKESELREAFEKYGEVSSVKIITDKITRQSKGFGFVEMPNEEQGQLAIKSLNGADMYGRPLVVNESQKKDARPSRPDSPAPRVDRYTSKREDTPAQSSSSSAPGAPKTFRNSDRPSSSSGFGGGKSKDFGRDRNSGRPGQKGGSSKRTDSRKNRGGDDDWY